MAALPPGTPAWFRAVALVGRPALTARYLQLYRHRAWSPPSGRRWRFVHTAARLADPIPEERPALLHLLARSAGAMSPGTP